MFVLFPRIMGIGVINIGELEIGCWRLGIVLAAI